MLSTSSKQSTTAWGMLFSSSLIISELADGLDIIEDERQAKRATDG
jgi:hypothetical protein